MLVLSLFPGIGLLFRDVLPNGGPRCAQPTGNLVDREALRPKGTHNDWRHILPFIRCLSATLIVILAVALTAQARVVIRVFVPASHVSPIVSSLWIGRATYIAQHRGTAQGIQSHVEGFVTRFVTLPVSMKRSAHRHTLNRCPAFDSVVLHQTPNNLLRESQSDRQLALRHSLAIKTLYLGDEFLWIGLRWTRLALIDSLRHDLYLLLSEHYSTAMPQKKGESV